MGEIENLNMNYGGKGIGTSCLYRSGPNQQPSIIKVENLSVLLPLEKNIQYMSFHSEQSLLVSFYHMLMLVKSEVQLILF